VELMSIGISLRYTPEVRLLLLSRDTLLPADAHVET